MNCDECHKLMTTVHHCMTPDCCANCGEAVRWNEEGFRRGVDWARRVLESGISVPIELMPLYARLGPKLGGS